jgi:hypothetical protein
VQLGGVVLALSLFVLGIWVSLRLAIWPAHCVATGTLVRPSVIWRGMKDHSFDMFIMGIITTGPMLLFVGGLYLIGRLDGLADTTGMQAAATMLKVYVTSAFDAAMLIAYFEIFAMKAVGRR